MGVRNGPIVFPGPGDRRRLAGNATMRLPPGRNATIVRVERGTVLVTQEGDLEDHVLEAGDEIVLPRGGLAVAWALTDAVIRLRAHGDGPLPGKDDPAGAAA